ncbi:MAG: hypothetical protein GY793_08130 [Proteobacteria bacterium]|nr:hypothetical protein [Pseudomonadota bacterium]
MDFVKTILFSLAVMGCALWVGAILQAKADEQLDVACSPLDFAISKVQVIATGLVGYTPQWTYSARRVLVSGCYFFFSAVLFAEKKDIGKESSTGIRK